MAPPWNDLPFNQRFAGESLFTAINICLIVRRVKVNFSEKIRMKILLLVAVILQGSFLVTSESAFARNVFCQKQMEQAAVNYHTQAYHTTIRLSIAGFKSGPWTEAVGNNTGHGTVAVREEFRSDKFLYKVNAKQIGNSAYCSILYVEPAGLVY